MPTDGQLISLMSHTIGSIGQTFKDFEIFANEKKPLADPFLMEKHLKEIQRIYEEYLNTENFFTNR